MTKLSIIIPSRNERYLNQTIQSCFDNARGDLEVVVTLEGYWPSDWKDVTARWPKLHTVHHGEPRGLRAAINSAAASAISRGADYLLKLDAHCLLDEGFDVKLLADIEPNWIVVPRRKRLDAENWAIQDVGKPDIDYHYLSFPDDPNDFGGPGLNGKPWNQRTVERLDKPEYEIDDEMSSQGSAWLCASSYFTELELMDDAAWGPFWCEAQEVLMKAWLSGGRCVVNKKTWYAHLHKGKSYSGADGKGGRGYHLDERWLKMGRNQTMKWIWNEAWDKQTRPFEWLIDHFWPVPSWPENWRDILYGERKPRELGNRVQMSVPQEMADAMKQELMDSLEKPLGQGVKADEYEGVVDGLQIHSAVYGLGHGDVHNPGMDVTETIASLVSNNSLDIIVNNSTVTPGLNPFRGQKKYLTTIYSYDGGEPATVTRAEKEALIIGQPRQRSKNEPTNSTNSKPDRLGGDVGTVDVGADSQHAAQVSVKPTSATALNDFLIRRFNITPYRLRAPMPIELPNFHRNDLAQLFAELGFNYGAEIGVAEGKYSEILMKANPTMKLLLVDPWHHYSANPQGKSKDKHEYAYNEAKRKMADYHNVEFLAVPSMTAVQTVDDESLDFCYVDGNHLFDYVIQDLIEWSKRVRSGGLVTGDDYYALDQKRWTGGGVVEAVQAYTKAHQIPIWYVFQGHKSVDFMWVKP